MREATSPELALRRTLGNRAFGQLQAKLTISRPDDRFEQDAERAAEQVASLPGSAAGPLASSHGPPDLTPRLQRSCAACQEEESIQRQALDERSTPSIRRQAGDKDEENAGVPAGDRAGSAFAPHTVQPKLVVSRPGDRYEQEADRAADHVVQRLASEPGPVPTATERAPELQRECEECKIAPPEPEEQAEDEETDQEAGITPISPKRETEGGTPSADDAPVDLQGELRSSEGEGRPLPLPARQQMEIGFGQDFGHVRIHTGERSAAMNREIRAKAFTHRSHVYFNHGQFDPMTVEGQRLLAHELTHVVQQTGGRPDTPNVQRASQGEAKIGNWAHAQIQKRLRRKDTKLITEAPIPGGTRDEMEMNVVGFADFYKAEPSVISGIAAWEPAESKVLLEDQRFFRYVNMRSDWRGRADWEPGSDVPFGPRIRRNRTWDFNPNFPSQFWVGELKPLFPHEFPQSLAYHGLGRVQTGNYRQGFERFVKRAYQDNPQQQASLPAAISGNPLVIPDENIPDALNYSKFEQERSKTIGSDVIIKGDKEPKQRVWMYRLKDGIYVYFLVPKVYEPADFPESIENQLQQLDPLLKKLRESQTKMDNTLGAKREDPPAPQSSPRPQPRITTPIIQREEDWKKRAKDWEDARQGWVRGSGTGAPKPKAFLKEKARGVLKKTKIDKELGLRPTGKLGQTAKSVRQIRFWSSFRGRILGALRFRFGAAFEKVEVFFAKLREKFRKHRGNSNKLVSKNGIFSGWRKVATRAIIGFAVEIFKEMLAYAFRGFINCANGIVDAVLSKFTWVVDEAREEIQKEIEPVCCQVMDFKHSVEEKYKPHETTIATFTETIEAIQEWRRILDHVETAVRIGVQIISCGTPPGLGCLWGLVAQLGISAGLSLLARTDYFDEEIAKPAARSLMDAIVGDSLHNFLIELLEGTPLKPFLEEAQDCRRRSRGSGRTSIGGNLQKLDPNNSANAKAREEWEKEFGPKILKDLQAVFGKKGGKPVTKEELQKLVELLGKSKRTPEELKAMLEAARDPASGKLLIEKAGGFVERDELPEAVPKERKIDYEKATSKNPKYRKALGWNPLTFYPKPGVAVDSEEFADAVYDMQEGLRIEADGILGENTLIAFYERNKVKQDDAYEAAIGMRDEKREAKEKAARDKAEKEAKDKAAQEPDKGSEKSDVVIAVPVTAPQSGARIIGRDPHYLSSSPGWISTPFGVPDPEKSSYQAGERLSIDVLYWYSRELITAGDGMGHSRWIWFPGISAEFITLGSFNKHRDMDFRVREDHYFRLTPESNTVAIYEKGNRGIFLDQGGLL